jgi:hypothetical protein
MQQIFSSAEECRAFWKVKMFCCHWCFIFQNALPLFFQFWECPPLLSSGVILHFGAQAHDHFLRKATGKWACKICKQISRYWNLMGGGEKNPIVFLFLKIKI